MLTKYQFAKSEFELFWKNLKGSNDQPTAAVQSLSAKPGRRGRFSLRVKLIDGLDRFFAGQLFHVAERPETTVRFISTNMSHGDSDPENWFMLMHVEPVSCECNELNNVFLVSFEKTTLEFANA